MVGIRYNPPDSEENMDQEYGVNVYNKFALFLDDESDPFEILKAREEELLKRKAEKGKKDKSKDAPKPAKPKVVAKKVTTTEPQTGPTEQPPVEKEVRTFEKPARGNDRRPFGQSGNIPPRRGGFGQSNVDTFEKPPPTEGFGFNKERGDFNTGENRGSRGGRGGRGGSRGGRGGGRGNFNNDSGFGRFGKREYDRQSGSDRTGVFSGIKPVDKREGGGSYNWGNVKDEMTEQLNESQLSNEETTDWATASEEVENQDPAVTPAVEPVADETVETPAVDEPEPVKEMTLDEYKAQIAEKRAQASFNPRKANEGTDTGQWKKMFEYRKGPNVSDYEDSDEESDDERFKKKTVDIEITFNDDTSRRGAGPGGFRGRGRGRGNRGAPRGGAGFRGRGGYGEDGGNRGGRGKDRAGDDDSKSNVANLNDEGEFPSLN